MYVSFSRPLETCVESHAQLLGLRMCFVEAIGNLPGVSEIQKLLFFCAVHQLPVDVPGPEMLILHKPASTHCSMVTYKMLIPIKHQSWTLQQRHSWETTLR